jgi:glycosyltransferase involved in cell wall biosynthesis
MEMLSLKEIYAALNKLAPDVVLSFTVKCNLYAGLCRRLLNFKHVANISGLGDLFRSSTAIPAKLPQLLYRIALAYTEVVFFQNNEDRALLVENGAVANERSKVLPGSGVDLTRFVPSASGTRGAVRSFLIFGRLLPQKGFDFFIEAARALRSRYGERVAFWILGAPDLERAESLALLKRIQAAHGEGVVRYLNSTDDPVPYIREADVVVLPSTYNEGVPRSLLEAIASGKAVVTTDWKGCREVVEEGRNGWLVRPGDLGSLVEVLDRAICCDSATLAQFGRRSRELAEERFDEGVVLEEYRRVVG